MPARKYRRPAGYQTPDSWAPTPDPQLPATPPADSEFPPAGPAPDHHDLAVGEYHRDMAGIIAFVGFFFCPMILGLWALDRARQARLHGAVPGWQEALAWVDIWNGLAVFVVGTIIVMAHYGPLLVP